MKERIISAAIYGCLFIVVMFFSLIVDHYRNRLKVTNIDKVYSILGLRIKSRKHKKIFNPSILFSIPVVLLPCLLAGVRAETVGVDVTVYADKAFDSMRNVNGILGALQRNEDFEIGYKLLAYFSNQISPNFGVFLFFTELMIILTIYIVAYRRSPRIPVSSTIIVFLLFFYCATFNIMRQSIAAAFLVLGYQFYEEKKYIRTILCLVIANLFHSSTIIGIFLLVISVIMGKEKNYNVLLIKTGIISVGILVLFTIWTNLANFLISNSIIPERYEIYLAVFTGQISGKYSYYFQIMLDDYFGLFCRLVVTLVLIAFGKKMIKDNSNASVYWISYIFSFLINASVMMVIHSTYGMRIAWFTEFSLIFVLPEILAKSNKTNDIMSLRNVLTVVSALMYFSGFIIFGWHGILPFRFAL